MTWGNRPSLKEIYPRLCEDWDYSKNETEPEDLTAHSGKKVWWKCKECSYSWVTSPSNRTKKNPTGCPACSGNVATAVNNLAFKYPELLKEWDYDKNTINPFNILPHSAKKVWWLCDTCGHGWKIQISNRTGLFKTGCPACANQVVTKHNNLAALFPDITREWDHSKNKHTPKDVTYGNSNKKVWWLCGNCGCSWKALVCHRTSLGCGCPECSNTGPSRLGNVWLDGLGVKIREHYIKELGLRVDGFDPETNTVYEFLGDYWHGNPERFDSNGLNAHNKKTYGQLFNETISRLRLLEDAGYSVVFIWEKDFKNV